MLNKAIGNKKDYSIITEAFWKLLQSPAAEEASSHHTDNPLDVILYEVTKRIEDAKKFSAIIQGIYIAKPEKLTALYHQLIVENETSEIPSYYRKLSLLLSMIISDEKTTLARELGRKLATAASGQPDTLNDPNLATVLCEISLADPYEALSTTEDVLRGYVTKAAEVEVEEVEEAAINRVLLAWNETDSPVQSPCINLINLINLMNRNEIATKNLLILVARRFSPDQEENKQRFRIYVLDNRRLGGDKILHHLRLKPIKETPSVTPTSPTNEWVNQTIEVLKRYCTPKLIAEIAGDSGSSSQALLQLHRKLSQIKAEFERRELYHQAHPYDILTTFDKWLTILEICLERKILLLATVVFDALMQFIDIHKYEEENAKCDSPILSAYNNAERWRRCQQSFDKSSGTADSFRDPTKVPINITKDYTPDIPRVAAHTARLTGSEHYSPFKRAQYLSNTSQYLHAWSQQQSRTEDQPDSVAETTLSRLERDRDITRKLYTEHQNRATSQLDFTSACKPRSSSNVETHIIPYVKANVATFIIEHFREERLYLTKHEPYAYEYIQASNKYREIGSSQASVTERQECADVVINKFISAVIEEMTNGNLENKLFTQYFKLLIRRMPDIKPGTKEKETHKILKDSLIVAFNPSIGKIPKWETVAPDLKEILFDSKLYLTHQDVTGLDKLWRTPLRRDDSKEKQQEHPIIIFCKEEGLQALVAKLSTRIGQRTLIWRNVNPDLRKILTTSKLDLTDTVIEELNRLWKASDTDDPSPESHLILTYCSRNPELQPLLEPLSEQIGRNLTEKPAHMGGPS